MVDDLVAKKTTLSDAQFGELEIAHGVKYQEHGLLFDGWLRAFITPISSYVFDWMHVFCTSGGVAQFHINAFIS